MSKKPLRARFEDFVLSLYRSLEYFVYYNREKRKYGDFYFPYQPLHNGEAVYILANGPSLKDELDELFKEGAPLNNSLVVNYFVETDYFTRIKPKYYCLADPVFNRRKLLNERDRQVYELLNEKVDWPITLFVWKEGESITSEIINNPLINVVGLSTLLFQGFESKRFKYYKIGRAVPSYVNVTIMGLYALLNMGYSTIYLYGVAHSFLAGLGVNDNNRLCIVDKHFYGVEKYEFQPKEDGSLWTTKDFVYDKYLTFVEHEVMRGYADYLGAQIINCTRDSWIDAYVRKAQLDNNENFNKKS